MRWFPATWWLVAGVTLVGRGHRPGDVGPGRAAAALLPLHSADASRHSPIVSSSWPAAPGTRVVGVYEWALGDKSRRANAALTGLGSTRRILVSDTMLADYSDDEIEVVLAHELGHHVHHDIWRGIALESALILLGLAATDVVLRVAGPSLGLSSPDDLAGMPLLVLTAGAVSLVLTPCGARALAASRAQGRPVRASADGESVGVHLGDAPARRAEPCRRATLAPRAVAVPQPSAARRAAGLRPRVAARRRTSTTEPLRTRRTHRNCCVGILPQKQLCGVLRDLSVSVVGCDRYFAWTTSSPCICRHRSSCRRLQ